MTLRPKQARFVEEYLIDLNATQAAIRAGYSAKTAAVIGYENLTKPPIAAAIATARSKQSERTALTADMVVRELAKLAFANMGDYLRALPGGDPYVDFSMLTRDQAAALREVTVDTYVEGHGENARKVRRIKFKLGDKRAALVALGKHFGLFAATKHEHTGKIEVDATDARERIARRIASIAARSAVRGDPQELSDVTATNILGSTRVGLLPCTTGSRRAGSGELAGPPHGWSWRRHRSRRPRWRRPRSAARGGFLAERVPSCAERSAASSAAAASSAGAARSSIRCGKPPATRDRQSSAASPIATAGSGSRSEPQ